MTIIYTLGISKCILSIFKHVWSLSSNKLIHICFCKVLLIVWFAFARAAAYSKLGNYAGAVQDCELAIGIDPNYSKAYGRMGYVRH